MLPEHFPPNSILVVDQENRLKLLECPFKVQAKYDIGDFNKGQTAFVGRIKQTQFEELVFIIRQRAYYPAHWEIL